MTAQADTPARFPRLRAVSAAFALTLSLALSHGALAQSMSETIDGWHVADYELANGPLDRYCRIRSPRADSLYLTVVNRVDDTVPGAFRGAARFDFNFESSLFEEERVGIENATLRVPGRAEWPGISVIWRARAQGGGYLRVDLAHPIDRVLPAVAMGRTIELVAGEATLSVPLAGSYAAVVAFERCLSAVVAR